MTNLRKPRRRLPLPVRRAIQRLTGVHRIHHTRFGFGWRLPLVGVAFFPAWTADGRVSAFGWRRVVASDFHDCTSTGSY